jgi:hypothetical protein
MQVSGVVQEWLPLSPSRRTRPPACRRSPILRSLASCRERCHSRLTRRSRDYLIVADPSEFAGGDLEAAVGEEIVENVEVADLEVIAETDA